MKIRNAIAAAATMAVLAGGAALLPPAEYKDVPSIAADQEQYFKEHGKYLQVGKGEKMPKGEKLPDDTEIYIYDGPQGKGYEVRHEDAEFFYVDAYGPEAGERTLRIPKAAATSTPSK